jgi:hypothetical protein
MRKISRFTAAAAVALGITALGGTAYADEPLLDGPPISSIVDGQVYLDDGELVVCLYALDYVVDVSLHCPS